MTKKTKKVATKNKTKAVSPPLMTRQAYHTPIHGMKLEDPYFWFREKENPKVIEHLKKENAYTKTRLGPFKKLQDKLYKELVSRVKEDDTEIPVKRGPYFYYTKVVKGQEHAIYCRRKGKNGLEEIILDPNKLAKSHKYFQIGLTRVSPNHKILAYSVDIDGSERYTMHFKVLATGKLLKDQIPDTWYSLEWRNDSKVVYYTRLNENLRPDRVFAHELGQKVTADKLLYKEKDKEFFVDVDKTLDDKYILVDTAGMVTSESYFFSADAHKPKAKMIAPRRHNIEYDVCSGPNDQFFIRTNDCAKNFKVVTAAVDKCHSKYWKDYIPHRDDYYVSEIETFKEHIVVIERHNGLQKIKVRKYKTGADKHVPFPESNYVLSNQPNLEYDAKSYRFGYSSLVTPETTFEYNVNTGALKVLKQKEVPHFNKHDYVTKRVFAKSHDGTPVPISLLYHRRFKKNGKAPCYLYSYGSYGSATTPRFRREILSLVNRGFVFAAAHIRGGSEMGRYWYEDGKLLKKKNTFLDFIACAKYLIDQKFTSKGEIVICGGSAGGMLVGATINIQPELFKAAVAHVPFVDVMNTMLDSTLPLTTIEYEEWGNPNDRKFFDYMMSYSPYDNVTAQDYPHVFATAGLNDPRVTYWEPAKWVAKLREFKTDKNEVLLYTNLEAGHAGQSGRFEHLKETAQEYAFVLSRFGIKE